METYVDLGGIECVVWTDEDGTMNSMIKTAYDEMIALENEAKTK